MKKTLAVLVSTFALCSIAHADPANDYQLLPTATHDRTASVDLARKLTGHEFVSNVFVVYPDLSNSAASQQARAAINQLVSIASTDHGQIAVYVRSEQDATIINGWAKAAGYRWTGPNGTTSDVAIYDASYSPDNLEMRIVGGTAN